MRMMLGAAMAVLGCVFAGDVICATPLQITEDPPERSLEGLIGMENMVSLASSFCSLSTARAHDGLLTH